MSDINLVMHLVRRIGLLLHRKPAVVQGAVLADLTAIWLAGHIVEGSKEETGKLREQLLNDHLDVVRKLVPENAKAMGTDL